MRKSVEIGDFYAFSFGRCGVTVTQEDLQPGTPHVKFAAWQGKNGADEACEIAAWQGKNAVDKACEVAAWQGKNAVDKACEIAAWQGKTQ